MKKNILWALFFVLLIVLFGYQSFGIHKTQPTVFIENVEALTEPEDVIHLWCCGTTADCAKGEKVTIKGTLSTMPCPN